MATLQQIPQLNVRHRNVRNGTILALAQTARLINFPLAQEVGTHVHRLILALKAPKDNDMSAQALAGHIHGLLDLLEEALEAMSDRAVVDVHGENARCLMEVQRLYDCLRRSASKLQSVRDCRFTTKLASQTEIGETIGRIRDELVIQLAMFNVAVGLANTQTIQWLTESLTQHLEDSDKRIERLEGVYAMQLARNMDGQKDGRVACFVLAAHCGIIFF